MVFDRTAEDVQNAQKIVSEKVKSFLTLTEEDKEALERGLFTINTANRIEEAVEELRDIVIGMGYSLTGGISVKKWTNNDVFLGEDLIRSQKNATILANSFVGAVNPPKEIASYHYDVLNELESALHELQEATKSVKGNYKITGIARCGN